MLDHAGVDMTMLALAMLDYASAECSESAKSVSGRSNRRGGTR